MDILPENIDEPYRHNQNSVGTFYGTSLLWSTEIKSAVGVPTSIQRTNLPNLRQDSK